MTVARERLAHTALVLAPRLLGAVLVSDVAGQRVTVRLTEVEAYEGVDDPASHAFRGRSPRNAVMFGPPGYLYCYFTYGMHWCANVVCGEDGRASAVLLRAGEVIAGLDAARARRPTSRTDRDLARGPARLAACLALGRATNGADLCADASPVRLASLPRAPAGRIGSGPRVGITAAADRHWRFWLEDDPTVSSYKPGVRRRARASRQDGRRD
jgi:DNA-3-methyladenine glycosylase